MFEGPRRFEAAVLGRYHWRAPLGLVERGTFWLVPLLAVFTLGSVVWPDILGGFASTVLVLLGLFCSILLYRWTSRRLLWTVRNRLVVTYLLMGLAPVVLFVTLAAIAAYLFSGQFATNTALAALDDSMARISTLGAAYDAPLEHELEMKPTATRLSLPEVMVSSALAMHEQTSAITVWMDGQQVELESSSGRPAMLASPFRGMPQPTWLQASFRGIVEVHGSLFLCVPSTFMLPPHHSGLLVVTSPLGPADLSAVAHGLGSISMLPSRRLTSPGEAGEHSAMLEQGDAGESEFAWVNGGSIPAAAHFFDIRVQFYAPLHVVDWQTGHDVSALISVVSRPSPLYQRLFANSVRVGTLVRDGLIVIAIVFGLLELLALAMAVRLSRTITASVADLYGATREIDQGHLSHRIQVDRHDQLAALATSFNTMAGSIEELLAEQREKERMQGELAIAKEVQNNLFPHAPSQAVGLEVYGICKPARSVSGDYYDFMQAGDGRLCLALGDISGKGISAALLMASLHSAVRAFQFGGASCSSPDAAPSPAALLGLLNHHLYSSTQPEKYATLFLACHDTATRELTYSNGGHLPPLVLCANGAVTRLECGGSVVGLLDGLAYREATVQLEAGDLLVAYSDGLTEPENDFGEFGEDRLLELIRQNRQQPLPAIAAHILRALSQWIGEAEQPDDMTLVLARQL